MGNLPEIKSILSYLILYRDKGKNTWVTMKYNNSSGKFENTKNCFNRNNTPPPWNSIEVPEEEAH